MSDQITPPQTPRWVKVFGVVAILLIVGFIALHLVGGGFGPSHGP